MSSGGSTEITVEKTALVQLSGLLSGAVPHSGGRTVPGKAGCSCRSFVGVSSQAPHDPDAGNAGITVAQSG